MKAEAPLELLSHGLDRTQMRLKIRVGELIYTVTANLTLKSTVTNDFTWWCGKYRVAKTHQVQLNAFAREIQAERDGRAMAMLNDTRISRRIGHGG